MADKKWFLRLSRATVRDYMVAELETSILHAQVIADDTAFHFDVEEDDGTPGEFVEIAKGVIVLHFAPQIKQRIAMYVDFLQHVYGSDGAFHALRLWVNYGHDLAVFLYAQRQEVLLIARAGYRFKVIAQRPRSEVEQLVDTALFLAEMAELYGGEVTDERNHQ